MMNRVCAWASRHTLYENLTLAVERHYCRNTFCCEANVSSIHTVVKDNSYLLLVSWRYYSRIRKNGRQSQVLWMGNPECQVSATRYRSNRENAMEPIVCSLADVVHVHNTGSDCQDPRVRDRYRRYGNRSGIRTSIGRRICSHIAAIIGGRLSRIIGGRSLRSLARWCCSSGRRSGLAGCGGSRCIGSSTGMLGRVTGR